ncbi:type IV pilus secretin PilQ family protein [Oleiagrimonas citrea]|uniref:Type IV pilus secretin PilQ n=1 Tax=Oleiagrimonas citrea TaxID=1665687 RepID=A0A846ZPD4_9GAMM|nr:type IV pilus secretin PilQ [Oleiagrimonas citrea]NKZ39408.1 type IV pilus secretin PilQ [Oleiagrimonas citrea]
MVAFRNSVLALLSLLALSFAGSAWATSTLKDVTYQTLPGGRVQLNMQFDGAPPQPKIFTTSTPPRIAVDLDGISNGVSKRHFDVGTGATSGYSVVSAGDRTRVVVELLRTASYHASVNGDSLMLTVDSGDADSSSNVANSDPSKQVQSADAAQVSNVDFRRGANGGGKVLISFTGSGADVNLQQEDDHVTVQMNNVVVPDKFAKTLDVTDFATPVQSMSTHATTNGGQMVLQIRGNVDTSAYQTNNQYVVDITPKRAKKSDKPQPGEAPVYSGKRVTFNFQNIPVRSALNLLAQVSGLNIVAADSVSGSVTVRLVNVPWDQALDVIMRAKGLDKRRNGNVIWIAPQEQIAKYEQNLAEARLKSQEQAELVSAYIPISYGKAADIAKLLTQKSLQSSGGGAGGAASASRGFLSPRGSVSYDERTNTLLINDTPEKIKQIRKLVGVLDRPVQQVLIESRIVAATDNFTRELGVRWGVQGFKQNSGNIVSTAPNVGGQASDGTPVGADGLAVGAYNVATGNSDTLVYPGGFNVNLPVSKPSGSIGLAILGANYLLDLELSAAQSEGQTEIISSPRVITANQQEALIRQGQEIGYVTFQNQGAGGGAGNATVQFKDAVLELKVTPTITADKRVYLKINVKKDALNSFIASPGGGQVPQIDTREINTSVLVDNGQTVVLGGIYEITKSNDVAKIPGLGDIPILGYLFRSHNRTNNKAELLIFVTPKILSETGR